MPRVAGIDPGSTSVGLCALDAGAPFLEWSCPTSELAADAGPLLDVLRRAAPLDLIVGPSGYGLPLVPLDAIGEREIELMLLPPPGSGGGIPGMRSLLRALQAARMPVVVTPGVVHLSSVPRHRKLNRVDLGTADKVCAAAFAIVDQARRLVLDWAQTAFVLVELGGAFTAVVTVEDGRVVSGQGGSSGPLGFRSAGALDGEAAFLLGGVDKATVFSGGLASVAGDPEATPEMLAARDDEDARTARAALAESVGKAVAGELGLAPKSREIVLSGRLAEIPAFAGPVAAALARFGLPLRALPSTPGAKAAALGAALLADGLAGGRFAGLVDSLRLRDAAGTVLDHLHLEGAAAVRSRWLGLAS
jgi:predicted butyrate kinase (DUF1464 family)